MDKVTPGWLFELSLAEAIAENYECPLIKNQYYDKRVSRRARIRSEHLQLLEDQRNVAKDAVRRLPIVSNGVTSVEIVDRSPEDLIIYVNGSPIGISVKWSDGIIENRGPRIGTLRGEYAFFSILGFPSCRIWQTGIAEVDKRMRMINGSHRNQYLENELISDMKYLADITRYQFSEYQSNTDFATTLVRSIYGDADLLYVIGSRKKNIAIIKYVRRSSIFRIESCCLKNRSTVVTELRDKAGKLLRISHRVKIKERSRMHGKVTDFSYCIGQEEPGVENL